jgi:hypothetical protein
MEVRVGDEEPRSVTLSWKHDGTTYQLDAFPLGFLEEADPDSLVRLAGQVRYMAPPEKP